MMAYGKHLVFTGFFVMVLEASAIADDPFDFEFEWGDPVEKLEAALPVEVVKRYDNGLVVYSLYGGPMDRTYYDVYNGEIRAMATTVGVIASQVRTIFGRTDRIVARRDRTLTIRNRLIIHNVVVYEWREGDTVVKLIASEIGDSKVCMYDRHIAEQFAQDGLAFGHVHAIDDVDWHFCTSPGDR